jgi:protein SCO1/2
MPEVASDAGSSEAAIAGLIDRLAADPAHRADLLALLHEDHAIYGQRGGAAVVRLRGWILAALPRAGVGDDALLFVLEELDTGLDPYPVAAAARALRAYPRPVPAFGPFLLHALANMAGHDEPISFASYGEYSTGSRGPTSATREILATFAWLGAAARPLLTDLERLRREPGVLSRTSRPEFRRAVAAIRGAADDDACCAIPEGMRHVFGWLRTSGSSPAIAQHVFEDHDGERTTFGVFFHGRPAIVVFFYTRCDNPLKCSLTVTKLGRVQRLLDERGLASRIRTAAISYDPGFDSPRRLRTFGERRGLQLGPDHRMLRSLEGVDALRRHFRLGVNFVESLVNRHRIEAYVLDSRGRIATSFERLRWSEQELVDAAVGVLGDRPGKPPALPARRPALLGSLPAVALAFLPKCPICWATYLSAFGVAGLERMATLSWLQPLLIGAVIANVAGAWLRSRATGRTDGVWLASLGAAAIVGSRFGAPMAALGVGLTLAGSLLTAVRRTGERSLSTAAG